MPGEDGDRGRGGVYVVKLGGSVITFKDKPFTPNLEALRGYARVLADLAGEEALAGIVIGGGSYGHYAAAVFSSEPGEVAAGLSVISQAMWELALLVADVLASEGVYTLIYPPHAMCRPSGLKPNCSWSGAVEAYRAHGVIPLTYGDVYPCNTGFCIVSGDELAMELACSIGANGVAYVTTVPGVLDSGRVIRRIQRSRIRMIASGGSIGFDVTGGMRRKLEAIEANWCNGLKRVIILGGKPEDLAKAIRDGGVGTEIVDG